MEVGAPAWTPIRHTRRLVARVRFAVDADRRPPLPRFASAYLAGLALVALGVVSALVARGGTPAYGTGAFVAFTLAAAVSGWLTVRGPGGTSYGLYSVFLLPLVVLCPPELVVFGGLAVVPRFVLTRQGFAKCLFNWTAQTLELASAWAVYTLVAGGAGLAGGGARVALAALAAAVVHGILSHAVVAPLLRSLTKRSLRDLGVFAFEPVSASVIFAALGIVVGAVWWIDPWLAPLALGPLLIVRRALHMPVLREQTLREPKTGLFNAEHFNRELELELERARRSESPLALLMLDLDHLREVNNCYGHLAGDAVLYGLAQVLRAELRERDVAARFGGEEFSVLLPGSTREQALAVAERVRASFAGSTFRTPTVPESLHATVSIGVAVFPEDGDLREALVHSADVALYRAKAAGRNCVLAA